ncbi:MAG: phosphoheptose isomerase [Bacteroidetes bacterium]|nr:phosphoheptose isomerase [Bacteroidota bacterium]
MNIKFHDSETRESVFAKVQRHLDELKLRATSRDMNRPWGGFFVIDESQAHDFGGHFFPGIEVRSLQISGKLSPKILMVQPSMRLSWQYHFRRAEIWKLVAGHAGVVTSDTDQEGPLLELQLNQIIRLQQGQRHRLVGLPGGWGMVAEIWQHTDINNPSDENDIVRLQDDFGR